LSYAHAQYAQSLQEIGSPRFLPACGGWVLERPISGGDGLRDAVGCYPLFACRDWSGLDEDLAGLRRDGLVSLVLVADPLTSPQTRGFDGVCRPWKSHHLVDLGTGSGEFGTAHHRRNARRFLRHARTEICDDPVAHLDAWCALYGELIRRHGVTGAARFSRAAFALQLGLPGAVLARAVGPQGDVLGMQLWFTGGSRAWHHLSGYAPDGYRWGGASYALMQTVLRFLRATGVATADLGAAAGLTDDPADGLNRFKAGWATRTADAWLLGAILDPGAYAALAPEPSDYFPAYRDPQLEREPEVAHVGVD